MYHVHARMHWHTEIYNERARDAAAHTHFLHKRRRRRQRRRLPAAAAQGIWASLRQLRPGEARAAAGGEGVEKGRQRGGRHDAADELACEGGEEEADEHWYLRIK
jgi:hypothetical protein